MKGKNRATRHGSWGMRENFFEIVGLSFLALILFTGGLFAVAQAILPEDLRDGGGPGRSFLCS